MSNEQIIHLRNPNLREIYPNLRNHTRNLCKSAKSYAKSQPALNLRQSEKSTVTPSDVRVKAFPTLLPYRPLLERAGALVEMKYSSVPRIYQGLFF
jgi:hypothetical protein